MPFTNCVAFSMLTTRGMETPARKTAGKQVKGNLYFHIAALASLDPRVREPVQFAAMQASLDPEAEFNVIKIDEEGKRISLLYYEHFFDSPFPALQRSCIVDLASDRIKHLRYNLSDNPPILHRKELLLPPDHPQVPIFEALTQQLEAAGLFQDSRRIGFAREWQERLHSAGYEVRDHCLIPLNGTSTTEARTAEDLARHKTALSRYALSAPMQ